MTSIHRSGIVDGLSTYTDVLTSAGGHLAEMLQRADLREAPAVALYASPPYALDVPALSVSRLSINLSQSPVTGGLGDDPPRRHLARRFSLFLTPAGTPAHWSKAQPSRHVNIYFDARAHATGTLLNAVVPGLQPLLEMLAAELTARDPFTPEAADSLATLILIRIARDRQKRAAADPLTPETLKRLREHVMEHLDQRLTVAQLAAAVGLSTQRFAAAFSARTGQTPHQYVLSCRLAHAAQLLRRSPLPLAQVAAACGFASQQHLTHWMRRRLQTTPARFRSGPGLDGEPPA